MTPLPTTTHSAPRSYHSRGYIVAAVHAGSRHFDAVVNRARELADATGQQVVFLTVVTRRPLSIELTRTRMRLARYTMITHLVGGWVDCEGLSPAQLNERIAGELVRGARELAAGTVILGLDPIFEVPTTGVLAHVATMLPGEIDLCFSSGELSDHAQLRTNPASSLDSVRPSLRDAAAAPALVG